jgi:hypothetical protein
MVAANVGLERLLSGVELSNLNGCSWPAATKADPLQSGLWPRRIRPRSYLGAGGACRDSQLASAAIS